MKPFYIAWNTADGVLYLADSGDGAGVHAVADRKEAMQFPTFADAAAARERWADALMNLDGAILAADEIDHQFHPDTPSPRASFRDDAIEVRQHLAVAARVLAQREDELAAMHARATTAEALAAEAQAEIAELKKAASAQSGDHAAAG